MSNNRSQSESLESTLGARSMSVSKKVHPEDIQPGDDVAVSEVMYQYPSYPWQSCGVTLQPSEPVNVTFLPPADTEPMVVCSVCLPFVLCKTSATCHRVFDLRQVQLVRLDKAFAETYRAARKKDLEPSSPNKEEKKKKKKPKGKGRKKKRKPK